MNTQVLNLCLTTLCIETKRIIYFCREYKICHCYTSSVNEKFYRTFVNENIKMI